MVPLPELLIVRKPCVHFTMFGIHCAFVEIQGLRNVEIEKRSLWAKHEELKALRKNMQGKLSTQETLGSLKRAYPSV